MEKVVHLKCIDLVYMDEVPKLNALHFDQLCMRPQLTQLMLESRNPSQKIERALFLLPDALVQSDLVSNPKLAIEKLERKIYNSNRKMRLKFLLTGL